MTVAGSGGRPREIHFPFAQRYEIVLRDEAGQAVWRYPAGRSFAAVEGRMPVVGGQASWTEIISVGGARGTALPPARHLVQVSLACDPADFQATVPFQLPPG